MWRRLAWVAAVAGFVAVGAYEVACVNSDASVDPCPQYCQNISATCSGDNAQFPDDNNNTCQRVCGAWEAGTQGVAAGNNASCRNIQQSNAKDDLTEGGVHTDCVNAGISSMTCFDQGATTPQCEAFCSTAIALCTLARTGYTDVNDCVSTCLTWDRASAATAQSRDDFIGPLIGSTGNTLQCRTYHLELSQTGNADDLETHCPHTGKVSARCFDTPDDAGTDAAPADAASE